MTGLRACHWSGVYEMNGPQQQSSTTAWRRTRHLRRRRTVSPPMSLWLFYVSRQCLHSEAGKTESVSMFVWINIKPSQNKRNKKILKKVLPPFPLTNSWLEIWNHRKWLKHYQEKFSAAPLDFSMLSWSHVAHTDFTWTPHVGNSDLIFAFLRMILIWLFYSITPKDQQSFFPSINQIWEENLRDWNTPFPGQQ